MNRNIQTNYGGRKSVCRGNSDRKGPHQICLTLSFVGKHLVGEKRAPVTNITYVLCWNCFDTLSPLQSCCFRACRSDRGRRAGTPDRKSFPISGRQNVSLRCLLTAAGRRRQRSLQERTTSWGS